MIMKEYPDHWWVYIKKARGGEKQGTYIDPSDTIIAVLAWSDSKEGFNFWFRLHKCKSIKESDKLFNNYLRQREEDDRSI